jgi:hypothetical protein
MNIEKKKAQAIIAAIYSGMMSHDQILFALGKGTAKKITGWKKQHNNADPSFDYLMHEYNDYPEFQKALSEKLKITREDIEKIVKGLMVNMDKFSESLNGKGRKQILAKVGRNELCHCGSGKKYKKCCLVLNK